jgi:hypothetical protein
MLLHSEHIVENIKLLAQSERLPDGIDIIDKICTINLGIASSWLKNTGDHI